MSIAPHSRHGQQCVRQFRYGVDAIHHEFLSILLRHCPEREPYRSSDHGPTVRYLNSQSSVTSNPFCCLVRRCDAPESTQIGQHLTSNLQAESSSKSSAETPTVSSALATLL
ncbi:hypothetical protein F441_12441 [Phytophthora nicotianae CJ01A1]|uniref:Uncharacterized protein n=4 Tax=Phytophthora nicotianae TaxID=4792 RepID=W2YZM8_PHYNI|nr:hypothetical protein L914_12031 [Phytophthora nicotianae]ETO71018.1 hypothetical protein F444_12568 [Phytophthora nicotianae P1976]ETP12128.1 hypothetical protein F441_12441 [Phytophthora nicotianae CJ01A1]ETP40235.1 hypothetical protein F442_12390 [Phytophthora nicotianae P10297]